MLCNQLILAPLAGSMQADWVKVIRELGSGVGGSVLLVRISGVSGLHAVKRASPTEHAILHKLHHPNIIGLHGMLDRQYVVLEYFDGIELFHLINQGPVSNAVPIFGQIAAAVAYLHSRDVVHGDLKPENIMVKGGRVKLVDFGMARRKGQHKGVWGSREYAAPEMLAGRGCDAERAELWSLGMVLFVMLHRALPADRPRPVAAHPLLPLMSRLLDRDPGKRPPCQAVVAEVRHAMRIN